MAVIQERRRTGWDVVFGILLIIGAFIILGNAVLATAVSIFFLGWLALFAGITLVIASFFRIKSGGFWSAALGGTILAVLGLFVLRNPAVGAVSLTLLAGAMFFASGLARIFIAFQAPAARALLIISGVVSVALGLIVLFNLAAASLTLLGVLIGVQVLVEGVTLLLTGRLRPVRAAA